MTHAAARVCPSCRALNKPKWEFCARCGEALDEQQPGRPAAALVTGSVDVDDDGPTISWSSLLAVVATGLVVVAAFNMKPSPAPSAAIFAVAREDPAADAAAGGAARAAAQAPGAAELAQGRRLLAAGDFAGALPLLAQAAGVATEDPSAQHAYATALFKTGQADEALARYRLAIHLAPQATTYRVDLARVLMAQGATAEAQQQYEHALAVQANDPRILEDLGQLYVQSGSAERAVPLLTKAVELRGGDDPRLLTQLGTALEKTGARGEAIEVLQQAVEQLPRSATARAILADVLSKDGRKEDALQVVRAGLAATPEAPPLHKSLGILFERSGQARDAAQAYRDYIRLAPDAPDAKDLAERANLLERRASPPTS